MPIAFIISGLFLLLVCFGVVKFYNNLLQLLLVFFNVFVILSYFIGSIRLGEIHINICQLISLVLFLAIFSNKYVVSIRSLLFIVIACILYYCCTNYLKINSVDSKFLLIMYSLFSNIGFGFNMFRLVLTGFVCICINCRLDIIQFTFSILDLNILYELIILYCIVYLFIHNVFGNKYNFGGLKHVEKNKFNYNYNYDINISGIYNR